MKNLAAELGQYRIWVNSVSPYAVTTSIANKIGRVNAMKGEALMQAIRNLKETCIKIDDVVNAALYLASDDANYVSGLTLLLMEDYVRIYIKFPII
ncbi:hypothetical protein IFM89_006466 [Coptis chinensis]|uniref:Uncharacterized protein n=1 Tax=Coptis chinensis TaxID=261450 RepID=A0A835ILA0_9MAGN|nr:hypothetical protein IFM89_006466 [Coptis chinensis]